MAELVRENVVKSADGTLYRVQAVGAIAAELVPLEIGFSSDPAVLVSLPISELRRVPDPRNRRPPIERLPVDRPRCAWCDRQLRPIVDEIRNPSQETTAPRLLRRIFVQWREIERAFCSSKCAVLFAGASYRGGFRRARGAR